MLRPSAVALAALLAAAAPAEERPRDPAPTITVVGRGEAAARPDSVILRAGVETRADSAAGAVATNSEAVDRVIAALVTAGIPDRSIQTDRFAIQPIYARAQEGESRLDGYQVANTVAVRLADVARLGGLLDILVRSGVNRVDEIRFELSDPAPHRAEARRAAVAEARLAAETYAEAADLALGPIRQMTVREGSIRPLGMPGAAMRAAADVPIAPGETAVSAEIEIVWELAPR
ncbi:MAG: SIMPL domain-containing protein [Paracoccaceae bacterium]